MLALDVDSRIDITGCPRRPWRHHLETVGAWVRRNNQLLGWSWTANTLDWTQYASAFILDDDTFGLMDNDACRLGL